MDTEGLILRDVKKIGHYSPGDIETVISERSESHMLFHLSNRPMKEVSFYLRNWQFNFVILEFHLSRKSNISNELVNHTFFVTLI